MISTTLQQELAAHRRFQLLPAQTPLAPLLESMVHREFDSPEAIEAYQNQLVHAFVRFAAAYTPYYQRLLRSLAIDPASIVNRAALSRLPILTKTDLVVHEASLLARAMLPGEAVRGWTHSTGSSGFRTRTLMTEAANAMFSILAVRNMRWHRADATGKLAMIRMQDGDAPTFRDHWRYIGSLFATGPETAMSYTAPIERLLAWLRYEKPTCLLAYSQSLEHLALAAGELPVDTLRSVIAFSEQLSPPLRAHIETTFGMPVHQGYGLNEVGQVAVRCAAGRYHVHAEHCMVEIVDEDGSPSAPGTVGRIVVTGYRNIAMPLIRYDTGDLAQAVDGPCPCGRTLPSFGEIIGRYLRIAHVPTGTMQCLNDIETAMGSMPREWLVDLRQFQLHQRRDFNMELRLVAMKPLPNDAIERIQQAMANARPDPTWQLEIKYVDAIERRNGGKYEEFTSDFTPKPNGPSITHVA